MPVKFGEIWPKDKKVFGTVYFPGEGRQSAALGLAEASPRAGMLASYRGAVSWLQWTRKIESCRIRLKLCRRYLWDPCTTPAKFGENRLKDKKVFGTVLFAVTRQGRLALSPPRPSTRPAVA